MAEILLDQRRLLGYHVHHSAKRTETYSREVPYPAARSLEEVRVAIRDGTSKPISSRHSSQSTKLQPCSETESSDIQLLPAASAETKNFDVHERVIRQFFHMRTRSTLTSTSPPPGTKLRQTGRCGPSYPANAAMAVSQLQPGFLGRPSSRRSEQSPCYDLHAACCVPWTPRVPPDGPTTDPGKK